MSNADCSNRSPGRRVRLAGGLIVAAVVSIPVTGALHPAQAATTPSTSVARVAPRITDPKTGKDGLSLAQRKAIGLAAVAIAKKQTGKPYVWGAAGPRAFDCSGLTQWAYKKVGIHLPRVTYAQFTRGERVKWKNLAVGDLVFFNGQGHVGIISKRKGKKLWMIHAPHTGSYVQQVRLNAYRRATFSGAVRPF